jgi:hypothetical protein
VPRWRQGPKGLRDLLRYIPAHSECHSREVRRPPAPSGRAGGNMGW